MISEEQHLKSDFPQLSLSFLRCYSDVFKAAAMSKFKFICCLAMFFTSVEFVTSKDKDDVCLHCGESGFILVATMDGNLTALDFDTGQKCWSILLDPKHFISSTLSTLEIWENGTQVWLVPSLDGSMFKFNKLKLEPLPFNIESLLSHAIIIDPTSSMMGGKFKLVYGLHRKSGEIYYKCSMDGCEHFRPVSEKDAIIVEQWVQSVNAVDTVTTEQRWHFRVVEIKVSVINGSSSSKNSTQQPHNTKLEDTALVPVNNYDFNPMNCIKISLVNGYAARINQTMMDFTWLYKTSAPLMDVWFLKDRNVLLLDAFPNSLDFYNIETDDGKQIASLFLGSYLDQLYVKQSKLLRNKVVNNFAVSTQTPYQAICLPLTSQTKPDLILPTNDSNALISPNLNIKDHGFYYYVDFSVYDNNTHCVLNFTFPARAAIAFDWNFWLRIFTSFMVLLIAVVYISMYMVVKKFKDMGKRYASEGTSTMEMPLGTDANSERKKVTPEFISRFHKDFQLIATLGKGGFGVVMEVKNKIDDCEYAVKRIRIRADRYNELGYGYVMREVKTLAKLDHPGIVRYFNSWIESPPKGWQDLKDKELDIVDITHTATAKTDLLGSEPKIETQKRLPLKAPSDKKVSSTKTKSKKPKQDILQLKISEKLGMNPLNPFGDNWLHSDIPEPDSKGNKTDNSSDSGSWFGGDDDGGGDMPSFKADSISTLDALSKRSISEESLYYDDESANAEDFINDGQLFAPRKHIPKSLEDSKIELVVEFNQDLECAGKFFDIRRMFSIPDESFIDEKATLLHLKKINNHLSWKMNPVYINKLQRYLFFDPSCPDTEHSDWSGWTCVFKDIRINEVEYNLCQIRNWIISVLCVLRFSSSHYHNMLCDNLCNILWEINVLLEDDICKKTYSDFLKTESTNRIGAFFFLKNFNSELAWPLKFLYLIKLRHFIFCRSSILAYKMCDKSDWKSIFYQADTELFMKNLKLFQIWIISVLSKIQCEKLQFLDSVVTNLSYILPNVMSYLKKKSLEPVPEEEFFNVYGNSLNQLKGIIQLRGCKNIQHLVMFHNAPISNFIKDPLSEEEDVPGFLYIQMELCQRESLKNWLDNNCVGRDYNEVMLMFCQIVGAMNYVHTKGLMHRDLKPSNIYFSLEGSIKIGDFGLATQFGQEVGDDSSSSSAIWYHTRDCGTQLYMSPEQRSKQKYNYKTDIFPLGIIMYELLVPFETNAERYQAIISLREHQFSNDFVSSFPAESLLVRKLLDFEPKRRPSASEIMKHPLCQRYFL